MPRRRKRKQSTMSSTSTNEPTYYELLGVSKDASLADIKKAYKRLAMKYHPDRNPGNAEAEEMFKKLSHAYEVLSDDEKRRIYDQYGEEGLKGGGFSSASADSIFRDFFSAFGGGDDLFGSFFGMGGRNRERGPRKTRDLVYELPVPLSEMYNGRVRKLKITRHVICSACDGTGSKTKTKPEPCSGCKGSGMRMEVRQMGPGFISQTQTVCPLCKGEGKTVKADDRCKTCNGERVVEDQKILEVPIDKGSQAGEKIVFEGESDQLPDTIAGDVVVVLREKEEKGSPWERVGDDLIYTKKIPLVEALTGCEFVITHLDGRKLVVKTEPKEIVKPNDVRVVQGEGMPVDHTGIEKGKLFIRFDVEFPNWDQVKPHVKELKRILPPAKEDMHEVAAVKGGGRGVSGSGSGNGNGSGSGSGGQTEGTDRKSVV